MKIEKSSGNVFRDIGCSNPEEKLEQANAAIRMSKHPRKLEGWDGSLEDLAVALENLQYDKLTEFLAHLSQAVHKRSKKDREAGRDKLSSFLFYTACSIEEAEEAMRDAWKICEPFMKK